MRLGANAIDGNTSGDPLLDLGGKTSELGVGGRVKVVVVDVTLSSRVYCLGCLESDTDKVLTEDVVEDTGAKATVLLELRESQYLLQLDPSMGISLQSR